MKGKTMLLKRFVILAVAALIVSPALAQNSTDSAKALTPSQIAKIRQIIHSQPNHRATVRPAVSATSSDSYNWGGYVVTGTNFTDVKGSWVNPTIDCAMSPNSAVVFWVGLDGWDDGFVEQTGTGVVCDETTPFYYAWYEFYPAEDIIPLPNMTVTPGDKFSGGVHYSPSTQEFTLTITDETTGTNFTTTGTAPGAARSSAEWIIEAPGFATGIINLSDFGEAFFGDDYTGVGDTNQAADSTTNGSIKKFGANTVIVTQVDVFGNVEQQPSLLTTDGSSFDSLWKEYN
jgi:Peptidase A4 family